MEYRSFYSKLLLFGEYSVIFGSKALAIPFNAYSGRLGYSLQPNVDAVASNTTLKGLLDFVSASSSLNSLFKVAAAAAEIARGLYFISDIPVGYGVGSSGALSAAFYDAFAIDKKHDLETLKRELAMLESCFHGSSSGFDPLVSYINNPILTDTEHGIRKVSVNGDIIKRFFIVDTGIQRESNELIRRTASYLKENSTILKKIDALNDTCISSLGSLHEVNKSIGSLSELQFEVFNNLIPSTFIHIWEDGLNGDTFKLKLCGAGGGGFMLGYAQDVEKCKEQLECNGVSYRFIA